MGRITIDQSHQVMAVLATNAAWEEIDFEETRLQDLVIRNPNEAGRQFTAFLKNGGRMRMQIVVGGDFPVWKTIELGTGLKTANDFCRAFNEGGLLVTLGASGILRQPAFKVATKGTRVVLVVVSVAELGFPEGALQKDTFDRAQDLGLGLCPTEVGPQLRLQYKDQPLGESLLIGMEPIADSVSDLNVFVVEHNERGLWLSRTYSNPNHFWRGEVCWVFLRYK